MKRHDLPLPEYIFAALLPCLCTACATQPSQAVVGADTVSITNLQYGRMCNTKDGPWLCAPGKDVDVTAADQCVYNHQVIACTWYGFSFDYVAPKPGVTLDCQVTWSEPSNVGNPEGIRARAVTSGKYQIHLEAERGKLSWPQYTNGQSERSQEELSNSCSYKGNRLFDVTLRMIYSQNNNS
jgi:hypothetical protein